MIRFCIVATARSGSSYLATALASYPNVVCLGEIFHPNVGEHFPDEYATSIDLGLRERDAVAFVDRVYGLDNGAHAAGFKIFRGHNDVALAHILSDRGIKKIVLRRENVLASFSSLRLAIQTGHWQARLSRPPPVMPPAAQPSEPIDNRIIFDPREFLSYWNWDCATFDYYRGSILSAAGDYLETDYLTVTSGDLFAIEQFLDLPAGFAWRGDTLKVNTRCILDRFHNPDDVIEFVDEFEVRHWLNE
jgi:hypothetical protein